MTRFVNSPNMGFDKRQSFSLRVSRSRTHRLCGIELRPVPWLERKGTVALQVKLVEDRRPAFAAGSKSRPRVISFPRFGQLSMTSRSKNTALARSIDVYA